MTLSKAARTRGIVALLAITFLMYCGFFMVIPMVSVYYVESLGFAAATVGIALALRQLLQQGITLVGGMLADLVGVRGLIGAGVLLRAVGFVSLAWAVTPPLLLLSMVLSALGGALFDAPSRAALAALAEEDERARVYSINGVAGGLGMTVGPLVGAMLLRLNFQTVALSAAGCFLAVFLVTLLLPPVKVSTGQQPMSAGLRLAFGDRPFLVFTALLMGYWFMWVQITLSLPLAAERLTGNPDTVGLVYALNSGLTVLLQYPVLRLAERRLRPMSLLIVGVAIMALGLASVAVASTLPALLACVVVFTGGAILASPTQQSVTASLADERALGTYFGVSSLALAFGGALGNLSGGFLTDAARSAGIPALPWLTFGLVGLGAAGGLAMLARALQGGINTAHLVAPPRASPIANRKP
jgi:DHA1 family multidrug resistance protein-like MFS transporter